jgi:capsular polysaccharide export protein
MTSDRVFLFLQGPSSPVFARIADRLEARGARCLRINICTGDRVFWRRGGAYNYRGRFEDWPAWLGAFLGGHGVTDIVLLGEERPYHAVARALAKDRDIDLYVVEMGYLRPDWITLERGGMSSNSHFPDDPERILAAAVGLPEPDWQRRYAHSFAAEAAYDLAYNLPNVFLPFLHPHYRRHAIDHPLAEYAGWLRRLVGARARRHAAEEKVAALCAGGTPFYLMPLQLQTDFQIRAHSPFAGQEEAIAQVIRSFTANASDGCRLVFKTHPLDNGLIDWAAVVAGEAAGPGVGGKVTVIDGGDLDRLIDAAEGVVTINSTVGLHALRRLKPTTCLGTALFDIEGLCDQRPLDQFWRNPAKPDPELCRAFFRLLAVAIHVRGTFYAKPGIDAAAEAIADRLVQRTVNEPGAFVDPPPRKPADRAGPGASIGYGPLNTLCQ